MPTTDYHLLNLPQEQLFDTIKRLDFRENIAFLVVDVSKARWIPPISFVLSFNIKNGRGTKTIDINVLTV